MILHAVVRRKFLYYHGLAVFFLFAAHSLAEWLLLVRPWYSTTVNMR